MYGPLLLPKGVCHNEIVISFSCGTNAGYQQIMRHAKNFAAISAVISYSSPYSFCRLCCYMVYAFWPCNFDRGGRETKVAYR